MQKSALLRELQQEIRRHNFDYFIHEPRSTRKSATRRQSRKCDLGNRGYDLSLSYCSCSYENRARYSAQLRSIAKERRICYFAIMAVRSCRVTIHDLEGIAHTVEVTAETLPVPYGPSFTRRVPHPGNAQIFPDWI